MSALTVLGIETSCDETAASVVRLVDGSPVIASNIVASQIDDHAPFGGVVPEIAARAHLDGLDGIIAAAMREAETSFDALDGIAVTSGPGLAGGLIVGSMTARAIAMVHDKPLLTINHLEGHALTARLTDAVDFPYLLLLVSGGHTQILRVDGVGDYTRLGTTIDDALGEAFDKTAKLLGLPYPGGPQVEKAARDGDPKAFAFPRPLAGRNTLDMSFSGLKTAVRTAVMQATDPNVSDICASFQAAVGDVLVDRLARAMDGFGPSSALVVAGGVAANAYLAGQVRGGCADPCLALGRAAAGALHRQCRHDRMGRAGAVARRVGGVRRRHPPPLASGCQCICRLRLGPQGAQSVSAGPPIAVIGAGAWGTALAQAWAGNGALVTLIARTDDAADALRTTRESPYLPGIPITPGLAIRTEHASLGEAEIVALAVPAQTLASVLEQVAPHLRSETTLVLCCKGIDRATGKTMAQTAAAILPDHPVTVLSGPSFAHDVARGRPTAVTLAAHDLATAREIAALLSTPTLRLYASDDVSGVEAGGALKNVLALAVGITRGLDLGASAEAALIARGFAEMTRLAEAMGAQPQTLAGLSGLGDLVLTCSSPQSRNFAYGMAIGGGESLEDRPLAEGVHTARAVTGIASPANIDIPIMATVTQVLDANLSPREAVTALLSRPLKAES